MDKINNFSTLRSPSMIKEELRRQHDDTEASLFGSKILDYEVYRKAMFRRDLLIYSAVGLGVILGVILGWS